MKVNFISKPSKEEIYPSEDVFIEKAVRISPIEFQDLIDNPHDDRNYIKQNKKLMYKDEKGYTHCIAIVATGYDYMILINSDGSDYPKYTAYLPIDLFKI